MDLAFHRSPSDIEEDLEYYFTDQRDLHNQIRPSDDIRSFTPDSDDLAGMPAEGKLGNVFHPFAPYSLDRIFIGTSFPLFSNNWGAAFLRHLLGLIKPDGAIVLPVYPEARAHNLGFWCRSSLENIFRSRTRFKGMSNIWAENDGVMSMRVGRRPPPVIPSTARWLFNRVPQQAALLALERGSDDARAFWLEQMAFNWTLAHVHAISEQIIRNEFGPKRAVSLALVDAHHALLALEFLYSPYTRIASVHVGGGEFDHDALDKVDRFCSIQPHGPVASLDQAGNDTRFDVVCITAPLADVAASTLPRLAPGGIVILTPECAGLQEGLESELGETEYYSDRVARNLDLPMYHYSPRIEEEIARQKKTREGAFLVLRKPRS